MKNEIVNHWGKPNQWGGLCLLLLLSFSSQASLIGLPKDHLLLKSEHWLRETRSANLVLKPKTPVLFVECSPVQSPVSNTFLIRERLGKLNYLALAKLGNSGKGNGAIAFNLFPEVTYVALKQVIYRRSDQDYTWIGRLEGLPLSRVVLVVKQDRVTGNISLDETVYWIRPVTNGNHRIQEPNPLIFPLSSKGIYLKPSSPLSMSTNSPQLMPIIPSTQIKSIIDLLVVYTSKTKQASADILSEISLAVAETNQIYLHSGIYQKLHLVKSMPVTYQESGQHLSDLNHLTYRLGDEQDPQGQLDEVHQWRDDYLADVVSLWVEKGDARTCGVAWVLSPELALQDKFAFSVVDRLCAFAPSYSFAHELGHNMGATHDHYVASANRGVGGGMKGAYPYSHGYVYLGGAGRSWRTILASEQECIDQGYRCPRLGYFSNPDLMYHGIAMGNSAADNRLTLNNTAPLVAAFR